MSTLQLKTKKLAITLLTIFTACLLFLFLFTNMILSQLVSPIYFQLARENKNASVSFLKKIKNLPHFIPFLEMNKNIYGEYIEQEVFAEDNKRKEMIAKFESLLEKNKKSRDLLYNLYLLYQEDKNYSKAQEYLDRAKEVDPLLNIKN